jgi:Ino eighty subunit 1
MLQLHAIARHRHLTPAVMDSSNLTVTPSAPRIADEPDARNSIRHILATEPGQEAPAPAQERVDDPPQEDPSTPVAVQVTAAPLASLPSQPQPPLQPRIKEEPTPSATSPMPAGSTPASAPSGSDKPMYTATTTTTRRNANGSVSSVYSGNKIRHLKKEDGVPLWRKDIQFDFLKYVFEDEQKVFHKVSDKSYGHTFADIYLDAMAKSSKCSKILKDKLLTERPAALNMAMVCLLVNVGRMNTTLNCTLPLSSLQPLFYLYPAKFSPRCVPSCEHTTLFRPFKPTKIQMHTSNSKTHHD